jgi:Ti type entry exclusion protein TrbK
MVKRPIIIITIIGIGAIAASTYWAFQRTAAEHKAFFGAPQKYDMTHGQEMRPRW